MKGTRDRCATKCISFELSSRVCVADVLAAPDGIEQFKKSAFEQMSMTPAEFRSFVQSEQEAAVCTAKKASIKQH
ncbi:MAG TPA: hypothetical protein VEP69_03125 [Thermodesulfovibrionales bacterium]|nr:hypothetical protein [Thermodesulfovibrionales bacterium]